MVKPRQGQFGYNAKFSSDYSEWGAAAGHSSLASRSAIAQSRASMTAEALAKKIDLERRRKSSSLRSSPRSGIQMEVREGRQSEVPFASDPKFKVEQRADGRKRQRMAKAPPETEPCEANRIWSMESVATLAGHMRCPGCKKIGGLVPSKAHERPFGLMSVVGLYC